MRKGSFRSGIVFCFLLVISLCVANAGWAEWSYPYETAWLDDFNHTIGDSGTQPPKWLDASNGGSQVEMAYSYQTTTNGSSSYVAITRSSATSDWGNVYSENIQCNVDIYDTLEMRVVDSSNMNSVQWKLGLQENSGNMRYFEFQPEIGATGTFAFQIRDKTGWTGLRDFSVQIKVKGAQGEYLLLDYISVFQNSTNKKNFWREDFIGPSGNTITSWWSEGENNTFNAEIYYSDSAFESCGNVRLVDIPDPESRWGKVLSPSIYWDRDEYNYLEVQITNVSLGPAWKLIVMNPEADGEQFTVDHKTNGETGVYTYDMYDYPGWIWDGAGGSVRLCVALIVEGEAVGANYDIDYVQIYKPQSTPTPVIEQATPTPSPTVEVFPQGGFVSPNPFLPKRGDIAFFNFQMPAGEMRYVIRIMDLHGRVVKTLASVNTWDGRNNQGHWCEAGIYIYQIEGLNHRVSGKVVVIH